MRTTFSRSPAGSTPRPSSVTVIWSIPALWRASRRIRPVVVLAGADPLLGRLDRVVQGVADQVVERGFELVEDVAVDPGVLAPDLEADLLAQLPGDLADHPGEPADPLRHRPHPAGQDLVMEPAGEVLAAPGVVVEGVDLAVQVVDAPGRLRPRPGQQLSHARLHAGRARDPPLLRRLQRLDQGRLAGSGARPGRRRTAGAAGPGPGTRPPGPSASRGSPPRPGPPGRTPRRSRGPPGVARVHPRRRASGRPPRFPICLPLPLGEGRGEGRGLSSGPRSSPPSQSQASRRPSPPAPLPEGEGSAGSTTSGSGSAAPVRSRSRPATDASIRPSFSDCHEAAPSSGRRAIWPSRSTALSRTSTSADLIANSPRWAATKLSSSAWATRTAASRPTILAAPLSEWAALISDSSAAGEGVASSSRASKPSVRERDLAVRLGAEQVHQGEAAQVVAHKNFWPRMSEWSVASGQWLVIQFVFTNH